MWVGDWLGRRKTIVLGGVIMIIGAILQTASYGYAQMIVARVVTGLGNGLNVSRFVLFLRGYSTETQFGLCVTDLNRAFISRGMFPCGA